MKTIGHVENKQITALFLFSKAPNLHGRILDVDEHALTVLNNQLQAGSKIGSVPLVPLSLESVQEFRQ